MEEKNKLNILDYAPEDESLQRIMTKAFNKAVIAQSISFAVGTSIGIAVNILNHTPALSFHGIGVALFSAVFIAGNIEECTNYTENYTRTRDEYRSSTLRPQLN